MKIRTSIFLVIIMLFFGNNVYAKTNYHDHFINNINMGELREELQFEQSLIKLSYESYNNKEQEEAQIYRIADKYHILIEGSKYIAENGHKVETSIVECNDKVYVDIDIISKSDEDFDYSFIDSISRLKFKDNKIISTTEKYKLKDCQPSEILSCINNSLKDVNTINYGTGISGTGYIGNKKISFAISHYDNSDYLFIGSPIINMSY